MFGRAVSGLNVYESKCSSMSSLRVELKERKYEISWFKLCSNKLAITSLTRSDLSVISNAFRTFGFQIGAVGNWADALQHARKRQPSSDGNCDLATCTDYANFFSSYNWCWKLKNYCEALIHSVCTYNTFYNRKSFYCLTK